MTGDSAVTSSDGQRGVVHGMDKESPGLDMDLAKTYADVWSTPLIGKLAAEFLSPGELGKAIQDQWFQLVGQRTRSLAWRSSRWVKPAEWAEQMVTICPGYNRFHAGKVGSWLVQYDVEVQPAREGSVCLYVRGDPEVLSTIREQAAQAVYADEADVLKDGTLRLWWD